MKTDKKRKKQLKKQFKQKQRYALSRSFPVDVRDLEALIVFLESDSSGACDHTLKQSIQFLESRNIDPDLAIPWLREQGGYCDCEVVLNVADRVDELL